MSRTRSERPSQGGATPWTPARVFLAFSATYHLVLGIAGLAVDQTFPVTAEAARTAGSEYVFGTFETNGWHSALALLLGLASLCFVVRPRRAREAAIAIGLSQVFAVVSLAVEDPSAVLLAANGADQVIHTITAIGGITSGLLTLADRRLGTSRRASGHGPDGRVRETQG